MVNASRNDFAGAIANFNDAIRLKPDFARAYYNRGLAFRASGEPGPAAKDMSGPRSWDSSRPNEAGPRPAKAFALDPESGSIDAGSDFNE